jgi:hypothetical protein
MSVSQTLMAYYTTVLDESSDIYVREQVSICFRFVSGAILDFHEVFLAAVNLVTTLIRTLLLDLSGTYYP